MQKGRTYTKREAIRTNKLKRYREGTKGTHKHKTGRKVVKKDERTRNKGHEGYKRTKEAARGHKGQTRAKKTGRTQS